MAIFEFWVKYNDAWTGCVRKLHFLILDMISVKFYFLNFLEVVKFMERQKTYIFVKYMFVDVYNQHNKKFHVYMYINTMHSQRFLILLTHWGRVTHICVSKLTIIGSNNGLSLGRRQAIIWTNAEILLTGPVGTKLSATLIEIHNFYSRKCIWKCRLENGGHFVPASMC